jgi:hypothetical protein
MSIAGRAIVCWVVVWLVSGCAPIIQTGMDATPLPVDAGTAYQQATIVIVTSQLEPSPDRIDPVKLKEALEEQLRSSGVLAQSRVVLADGPAAADIPRIEITLSRLDYTIEGLRMPPSPPCGIVFLYPLIAPSLLRRDYLRHQVVVEGDLLLYDAHHRTPDHLFLSETATGQTDLFNSGGSAAAARLREIALHNFSRRALAEFLYLTRTGTVAKVLYCVFNQAPDSAGSCPCSLDSGHGRRGTCGRGDGSDALPAGGRTVREPENPVLYRQAHRYVETAADGGPVALSVQRHGRGPDRVPAAR